MCDLVRHLINPKRFRYVVLKSGHQSQYIIDELKLVDLVHLILVLS